MTHDEIVQVLITIRPNALWNLRGNTYEGLEWLDEVQVKPTANEIGLE